MRILFAAILLCLVSTTANAEIESYTFDLPHTQVLFTVNHLGFSNSHGAFRTIEGGFVFNRSEPERSKVDVTIKTASVDMNDEPWDKAVKGADFFNVEKFPVMTFVSNKVEVTGEKTGRITGDLTLLGITKPVTLDVVFNKAGQYPFLEKYAVGFTATAAINRSDFGMDSGIPMVSDKVDIRIEVEAFREGKGTENE